MSARLWEVDDTHWPVVTMAFDGKQSDEDIEHFIRRMDAVHARCEPFLVLTLLRARAADLANIAHVKRVGAWAKAGGARSNLYCKGSAIVAPSSAARFLISSFFLVFVPAYPMVAFEDTPVAVAWLRRRLAETGLPVPTTLASLEGSGSPAMAAR
jgi:hypothetical protein